MEASQSTCLKAVTRSLGSHGAEHRSGDHDCIGPELQYVDEDSVSYCIDKVVDCKTSYDGKLLYKVRWVGFTWVSDEYLQAFQDLIQAFLMERSLDKELQKQNDNRTSKVDASNPSCDGNKTSQLALQNGVSTEASPSRPEISTLHVRNGSAPETGCPILCDCGQRLYSKGNCEMHDVSCSLRLLNQPASDAPSVEPDSAGVANSPEKVESYVSSILDSAEESTAGNPSCIQYIPPDHESTCLACAARDKEVSKSGSGTGLSFNSSTVMENSRKKHASDSLDVYECAECGREILFRHLLGKVQTQWRSLTPSKPFRCEICSRSFDTEARLSSHERNHSSTSARYTCASCSVKFKTRDQLQEHYSSGETGCKPYQCKLCDRRFVHSNHLRRHMGIHAGVKPYCCEICGHKFNQRSDLGRHQKRHSLGGKLSCSKCMRDFESVSALQEHLRDFNHNAAVHGSFTCEKCNRVFGRKSHYKRHMSVHMGHKPHACDTCGKSFNQRTDLKRHQLAHSRRDLKEFGVQGFGEKLCGELACTVCGKLLNSAAMLKEHELSHQKIMHAGDPF